ncbi:MAG: hypothetical protein JO192_04225 [Candidatus Eremiobacteraeota bacterium]|nr:hypothetical protein [Candidatus Eremiobacteraeota bacterium]
MNSKRIAAFAVLATLVGSMAPAFSATTATGTITVKWNTSQIAQLTLHTNYTAVASPAHSGVAAAISQNQNGGGGTCTTTSPTNVDLAVDFGNVAPDFTKFTDCLYDNAMVAAVATNSTNWDLGQQATACAGAGACTGNFAVAGFDLCAYSNNTGQVFPVAAGNVPTTGAALGTARTSPASIVATGACPAGTSAAAGGVGAGSLIDTAGTITNLVNGYTTAFTGALPGLVGEDIELVIANNAPSVAPTVTETVTLTAN